VAPGVAPGVAAVGFAVLKGGDFLRDDVQRLQREAFGRSTGNWTIELDYHFGGYARRRPELDEFLTDFERRHGLQLNWTYTAKMLFGIFDLVGAGRIAEGTTVVAVITG